MDKKESYAGGWFGSWIQAAKEKSGSLLGVVGADLAEFSDVMRGDMGKMASSMMKAMQEKEEEEGGQKTQSTSPDKITTCMLHRTEAELKSLQSSTETYESDPSHDDFSAWKESFNLESHKLEISDMLANSPDVRGIFTQLVPKRVSNVDFWTRYFFQQKLLHDESARRMELLKRAEKDNDEIGWDEDEEEEVTDDEESTENTPQQQTIETSQQPTTTETQQQQPATETTQQSTIEETQINEETSTTPTTTQTTNNDTQHTTTVVEDNKNDEKNNKTQKSSDDDSDGHSDEWVKDFEGDLTGFKVVLSDIERNNDREAEKNKNGDKEKASDDSDKKPGDWEEW